MVSLLIAFLIFVKVNDPLKLYREGKYEEFLKVFYSDQKLQRETKYFPFVALSYLNLRNVDSALVYYKKIPVGNLSYRITDGLSFKLAEELKRSGNLKEAVEAYYFSYLSGYRLEESKKSLSEITTIPEILLNDSVLKSLFLRAKVFVMAPFSGEYADIGEEFYNAIILFFKGDVEKVDEENRESIARIPANSIIIGPLKRSANVLLDSLYKLPALWLSPFTEHLPIKSFFIYSPYKTQKQEADFLVNYVIDSLRFSKVVLVRDTSYVEEIFASYLKTALAARGKFLAYDICVVNPFEFDSATAEVDSEKIEVAIISGLSNNSYFLYSSFRTKFPGKPILGTSAWLTKVNQVPKYMLDLTVCSVPVTMGRIFRNAEIKENFLRDFYTKYSYYSSEIGIAGLDIGILLNEAADTNVVRTLINLTSLSGYVAPSGAVYHFSGNLGVYEIIKGDIKRKEERYDGEEN